MVLFKEWICIIPLCTYLLDTFLFTQKLVIDMNCHIIVLEYRSVLKLGFRWLGSSTAFIWKQFYSVYTLFLGGINTDIMEMEICFWYSVSTLSAVKEVKEIILEIVNERILQRTAKINYYIIIIYYFDHYVYYFHKMTVPGLRSTKGRVALPQFNPQSPGMYNSTIFFVTNELCCK